MKKIFKLIFLVFLFSTIVTVTFSYEECNFTRTPENSEVKVAATDNTHILIATKNKKLSLYDYPYYTKKDSNYFYQGSIIDITFLDYTASSNEFAVAINNDIYIYYISYNSLSYSRGLNNVHSSGTITSLSSIPSYPRLLTGGTDSNAKVINYDSSYYTTHYTFSHSYSVNLVLVFSTYVYITATSDNTLHRWDTSSNTNSWSPHSSTIVGLKISNSYIISADTSGKIVWSYQSGSAYQSKTHSRQIVAIDTYTYEYIYYIAVIDIEGYISIWDNSGKKKEFKTQHASLGINDMIVLDKTYNENFIVLPNATQFEVWNITKSSSKTDSSGLCTTGCPNNQFIDYEYKCRNCGSDCKTCKYFSFNCTSCDSSLNMTRNTTDSSYTTCVPCGGKGCKNCVSFTVCYQCIEGYYLPNGVNGSCSACYDSNCAVCKNYNYLSCDYCKMGYYRTSVGGNYDKCNICYSDCKNCTGPAYNECNLCEKGYKLSKGECKKDRTMEYVAIGAGSFGGLVSLIIVIIFFHRMMKNNKKKQAEMAKKREERKKEIELNAKHIDPEDLDEFLINNPHHDVPFTMPINANSDVPISINSNPVYNQTNNPNYNYQNEYPQNYNPENNNNINLENNPYPEDYPQKID